MQAVVRQQAVPVAQALLPLRRAMNVSLYQAASALNANTRYQEVVAANLATSAVPGSKRQDVTLEAYQAGLLPASALQAAGQPKHFILPNVVVRTSFTAGQMNRTGIDTDVAIEGAGFFAVQMHDGAVAYTRDGQFHRSASGQLVTKQGFAVLGEGGPIQLDPRDPNPISIAESGEISQGNETKGRLKIVEFNNPQRLTQISGSYFLAGNPDLVEVAAPTSKVQQCWLEAANTVPMLEMANMISSMRAYEANQRVIQAQDERMGRVITELSAS